LKADNFQEGGDNQNSRRTILEPSQGVQVFDVHVQIIVDKNTNIYPSSKARSSRRRDKSAIFLLAARA
jgi:hypothetical protein